jgi:peptidoglycan/xylan/chitin deacetylase (PgdA/CDA1 family)
MSDRESLILTYHSLDRSGSVLSTAPEMFRRQLAFAQECGARVELTFDDGYANFHTHALPLLAASGVPATVFAVSGFAGGEAGWPGAAKLPLMSWTQLAECQAAGIAIGVHTARHADLTTLDEPDAIREMEECRDEIAQRLGEAPTSLAYPYGASNPRVRRLAAERFERAAGTRLDKVRDDADPYDLPRIEMYYYREMRRFRELLTGRGEGYLQLRRWLRAARERLC